MKEKLVVTRKKHLKGEDGYKIFSVRVKEETAAGLDKISAETNRSRNELINIFIEYGINNVEIK